MNEQFSIRIDTELLEWIRGYSQRIDVSMSDLVRDYFKRLRDGTAQGDESTQSLLQRADNEIQHLREQALRRDEQIRALTDALEGASQRHDTIVLQMTKNLESAQKQLEDKRGKSWWDKWMGKA